MKHPNLYLIGLTGGIACGKSTVLTILAELGAHTIDADQVTHRLQQPGTPVYQQIVDAFGPDILVSPDGPLDRRKLGAIVFNDPVALQRLEQIVHPAVHATIVAWLDQSADQAPQRRSDTPTPAPPRHIAVIDAVKLLEAGWKKDVDAIWVVTCAEEQQVKRLIRTRGMSEAEARQRIAAQPPQSSRIAQADVVIDNSGTLEQVWAQIEAAWQKIVEPGR
ncbi:MAG: dephospho-CoA kinase [Chloroflexales bacterium]|nr:dephospho-CoA kinase [Chloroflexales bacterium]